MRGLTGIVLVLGLAGQAGQQPVRDQPARQPVVGTGAVAGRVVNGESRQPVADAMVALVGGETAMIRVGQTDATGAFILPAVPPGKFVLTAVKSPYLGSMHGATRPGRPGTAVILTAGQMVTGLEIQMWPGAVLTGTVTDEDGEPVPDVPVHLQAHNTRGNPLAHSMAILGGTQGSNTDDRGVFRIYGVAPGEYFVSATIPDVVGRARRLASSEVAAGRRALAEPPATARPPTPAPAPAPPGRAEIQGLAPVYFPGTTDLSRAAAVTVGMGEERSGLNIRLELVRLARVEGVVYSATGSASAGTEVVLQRQDGNLMMGLLNAPYRAQTSATGQYLLRNVAPGHYRVLARSRRSGDSSVGPVFWATADVTISGQDQTGLTLQLQPGLTLAGRIVVEQTSQASPPDLTRVMALTVPIGSVTDAVDMLSGIMSVAGGHGHAGRADGTFEAAGLIPGVHLLSATTVGAGPASVLVWRVGSVVVDGRDVTDLPFDIKAGALPKEVVVTLTDVRQRLSGVIADSSGRPLTASTVLLFPTDRRYWYSQSQRVLAVRPSTDGSYEFGGFVSPAAGEYFLSVVTDMDPSQQYDPIFLDALAKAGPIRLILARGEHRRQDLKVR